MFPCVIACRNMDCPAKVKVPKGPFIWLGGVGKGGGG